MPDFIPRSDAAFASYVRNFVLRLTETPEVYFVSPEELAQFQDALAEFNEVFQITSIPTTRYIAAVTRKNVARQKLAQLVRSKAGWIRSSPNVDPSDKTRLGLRPRAQRVKAIPIPTIVPGIRLLDSHRDQIQIKLFDKTTQGRKGKPPRVASAEVWYAIGEATPNNDSDWRFAGATTGLKLTIHFPTLQQPGTYVHLRACWNNHCRKRGPLCDPIPYMVGVSIAKMGKRAA